MASNYDKTPRTTIRLACVPEQVNIPVNMIKELQIDEKYNINLQVVSVPEGTGKMLDMLEKNDVDIAMTVSDAFIVANAKGRRVELVGTWVSSPLVWAVAASPSLPAEITTVPSLYAYRQQLTGNAQTKLRVGISRPGSGSQTMASYMAMLHQLDYSPVTGLEFVVAHNFDGLKKGIKEDLFDVFLWETFTTKPDFDTQVLRKLDDVRTPWPAFSLVMSTSKTNSFSASSLLSEIQQSLFPALAEAANYFIRDIPMATKEIVNRFGHKEEDAALWLQSVTYSLLDHGDNSDHSVVGMDEHKSRSPSDENEDHNLHFELSCAGNKKKGDSEDGKVTLRAIDMDVYTNSVQILQSVGLVPAEFAVSSLWPSSSLTKKVNNHNSEYMDYYTYRCC